MKPMNFRKIRAFFSRKPVRGFKEKFGREQAFFGSPAKRKRPDLRLPLLLTGGAFGMLILLICVLLIGRMPHVASVTAQDGLYYSKEDVVRLSGIEPGDEMIGFDASTVRNRLKQHCPLMKQIRVKRHFGGEVQITFTEYTDLYYTRYHVNYYIINADNRRVLGVYPDDTEARRVGAMYFGVPEETHVRVGDPLRFGYLPFSPYPKPEGEVTCEIVTGEADEEFAYVFEFLTCMRESDFADRLSGMETADRYDLRILLDGYIQVRFGSMEELPRKLTFLSRVMQDQIPTGDVPVLIDVSDPSRIIFRESNEVRLPSWAPEREIPSQTGDTEG